jgi:hypothetical protein
MSNIMMFVWQNKEGTGEPDVEVKIPANMAKWVPRLMKFVPMKTKEETWGQDLDFDAMLADLDGLIKDVTDGGQPELLTVKTKDSFVRITVEK